MKAIPLVLTLLLNLYVQAQVALVPKAGLTKAPIWDSNQKLDARYTSGWMYGLGIFVPLTKTNWCALQLEVLYVEKRLKSRQGVNFTHE
jgi:hypothetical protein